MPSFKPCAVIAALALWCAMPARADVHHTVSKAGESFSQREAGLLFGGSSHAPELAALSSTEMRDTNGALIVPMLLTAVMMGGITYATLASNLPEGQNVSLADAAKIAGVWGGTAILAWGMARTVNRGAGGPGPAAVPNDLPPAAALAVANQLREMARIQQNLADMSATLQASMREAALM